MKKRGSVALVYVMVFLSGFAGLVYQVLWMKQLGFLFGNTSHAAAATLAAFFAGLAAGSWFWGRRSKTVSNPMRVYAGLEIGIAVTALLYFAVLSVFYIIYPSVYRSVISGPLLLAIKFLLALLLIFPPAFFMGGTIPIIGQAVIRSREEFGVQAAWLYGVNTLGAALGAFSAGFFFVRLMGFRLTCLSAMVITGVVAAIASVMASRRGAWSPESSSGCKHTEDGGREEDLAQSSQRTQRDGEEFTTKERKEHKEGQSGNRVPILAVCFLSGFGVLALEVLWTRIFAQIHENSIYSFSAVLVIVLLALALGAMAASRLARFNVQPMKVLAGLLLIGGFSVAVSPFVFRAITNDFQMLDTSGSFMAYTRGLFGKGAVIMGIPAFFLGTIFPFLMKTEERFAFHPGSSLGRLAAVNTVGAILGSVLCGFVLLGQFGMWRTMQLIAAVYLAAGILFPIGFGRIGITIRTLGAVMMLLLFTGLSPAEFRVCSWDPGRPPERLLEVWETSDCTISVVVNEYDGCLIKVNSNYRLGSTGAAWRQHFQGRMPLLAYPHARSVFFLGMGTGISVGGALDPRFKSVERVVACDLVPEVVAASKKYMTGSYGGAGDMPVDFTSGLFSDERVEIVIEDGRHYLMACDETFDIINCDLFLPYRSGAGSLYSREHFENAKAKLNSGGILVQWLPMYQVTEVEFGTIARTMLEVFDQVTIWRNNFKPGQEVLALVGHRDAEPVPACSADTRAARRQELAGLNPAELDRLDITYDEETALIFYCGNLTKAEDLFAEYPINTDDRPIIEYSSPLSIRKKVDGYAPTIVGPRYVELIDKVLACCPPDDDPMLVNRTAANRRLVGAGAELHRFWFAKAMGDERKARNAWVRFVRGWSAEGAERWESRQN